ncbi:hypothetical protein [Kitasatospora griseola]|uniref:hypothetical protein n=1 Tax=Kitasatospora griseola TaxID=2064 RepID=UPI0034486B5B
MTLQRLGCGTNPLVPRVAFDDLDVDARAGAVRGDLLLVRRAARADQERPAPEHGAGP